MVDTPGTEKQAGGWNRSKIRVNGKGSHIRDSASASASAFIHGFDETAKVPVVFGPHHTVCGLRLTAYGLPNLDFWRWRERETAYLS